LKNIAAAHTEHQFDEQVAALQSSDVWQSHPQLDTWFSNKWLPEKKVETFLELTVLLHIAFFLKCHYRTLVAV